MRVARKVIESRLIQARYIIAIIGATMLILSILKLYELRLSDKDVLSVLSMEATTLSEVISIIGENALSWQDRVLELVIDKALTVVRLLEHLEKIGRLDKRFLVDIAKEKGIVDVIILDRNGVVVQSVSERSYDDIIDIFKGSLIREAYSGETDEIVIELDVEDGISTLFIGKRKSDGNILGILIETEEMDQFARASGVGKLVQEIGNNPGIEYVVLQDRQGIILATRNIRKIKRINSDPFLMEALEKREVSVRRHIHEGNEVLEVVNPFPIEDDNYGLFRVGISMDEARAVRAKEKQRLLVTTVLAIISISIVAVSLIVNQNYSLLSKAYDRVSSYTATIIRSIEDGIIAVDKGGKITLMNEACEKIFGRPIKDLVGRDIAELNEQIANMVTDLFKLGMRSSGKEINIDRSNETRLLSLDTFRVESESDDSCVIVVRDITDARVMEENLRRTEQLTVVGKLASGMAHEVRNPLNAISMLTQRLNREFKPMDGQDKYNEMIQTILSEVNRINNLMEEFLRFARKRKPDRRETNIVELINRTLELISMEAKERSITIETDYEDVGLVKVDSEQIKQAILNILLNALDAIDKDGKISVVLRKSDENIMIEIADTGSGIPEEVLPRIFDLYYTTKDKGTGLGLSIVQKIVNEHDGWITVESKLGEGTKFRIYLPKEGKDK